MSITTFTRIQVAYPLSQISPNVQNQVRVFGPRLCVFTRIQNLFPAPAIPPVRYFKMEAVDLNSTDPTGVKRYWVVSVTPDPTSARYPSGYPFSGVSKNFSSARVTGTWVEPS